MTSFKYGAKSEKQEKFYESQFSKVRDAIEQMITSGDSLEWEKSWCNPRKPGNFCTGKPYTGAVNAAYLELVCLIEGFTSSQWAGAGQIREKGGKLNAGATGFPIFVPNMKKVKDEREPEGYRMVFLGWSVYTVFNVEQQTGIQVEPVAERRWEDIGDAEEIIKICAESIIYRESGRAYYSSSRDEIVLPLREQFKDESGFYGTAFHEIGHWTGNEKRLKRFTPDTQGIFGDETYSFEELVAEFTAAMLKVKSGIDDGHSTAAAYIKNWWSHLSGDISEATRAYGKALVATDYILNFSEACE